MKKLLLSISFILNFIGNIYAGTLTIPTTYAPTGTVTSTNLNGNFTAVAQILNGGIDNTNANTTQGYHLFQSVAVLPSFGNQGSVYFLTSDNTLNFDTGSGFIKSIAVNTTPAQGDIIYYTGSAWTTLTAGTSGQFLKTQGVGANPIWTTGTLVPAGIITLWSGSSASIPSGWVLCNGSNGTPDLRDKFLIGATSTYAVGASGGSTTISQSNLPAYNLTVTGRSAGGDGPAFATSAQGGASETLSINSGGSGTAYLQPYYALCYIMKS